MDDSAIAYRCDLMTRNDEIIPGFDEETCDYLRIRLREVSGADDGLILDFKGSIDTYNSGFVRRNVMKAISHGFIYLVFDLGGVDYVSSTGIGAFMSLQKAVKEKGGDATMARLKPKVVTIFKLMCLDSIFRCSESVDEALAQVRSSGVAPLFPRRFPCPICDRPLVTLKPGRFRCSSCKSILEIDEMGGIRLG